MLGINGNKKTTLFYPLCFLQYVTLTDEQRDKRIQTADAKRDKQLEKAQKAKMKKQHAKDLIKQKEIADADKRKRQIGEFTIKVCGIIVWVSLSMCRCLEFSQQVNRSTDGSITHWSFSTVTCQPYYM